MNLQDDNDRSNNNDNNNNNTESLIDEAINRILLDIVIRGHGDRLIGRWSRLERVQRFLEQVPYMLDRINQLHLSCMRAEVPSDTAATGAAQVSHLSERHIHHVHHHHHHHHQHQLSHQAGGSPAPTTLATSSLHDFVNLIGNEHHWLVRTRDTIGLTPLHKGVLFNNRPIVEYILDRYLDEVAATSATHLPRTGGAPHRRRRPTEATTLGAPTLTKPVRLIDAQDKYGRTALHYAAAALGSEMRADLIEPGAGFSPAHRSAAHLYGFLLAKGASAGIKDFRGKTAANYLQHPKQARVKNVIHLANKLNASYQASVLSRTLRAASAFQQNPILSVRQIDQIHGSGAHDDLMPAGDQVDLDDGDEHDDDDGASVIEVDCDRCDDLDVGRGGQRKFYGRNGGRESMSLSCNDLHQETSPRVHHQQRRAVPKQQQQPSKPNSEHLPQQEDDTLNESKENISQTISLRSYDDNVNDNDDSSTTDVSQSNRTEALKQLSLDRCTRPVLDANTKQSITKALRDGTLECINELIFDGYGLYLLNEAPTTCWSQKCKRYIERLVPNLLERVDKLHESIATNDSAAAKTMIHSEPQLARIRRPYKRACMSSIHIAAAFNRRSMVQYLIEKFPELLVQRDSRGASCLHWAARSLRSDRLYCWLVDDYGSQLEHLRDWRSKLAADYRQAAIRMRTNAGQITASGGAECDLVHHTTGGGRAVSSSTGDVNDILNMVQRQADELQFDVAKAKMNKRPSTYLRTTSSKSPSKCTPTGKHHTASTRVPSRSSLRTMRTNESVSGVTGSDMNNISENRGHQVDSSSQVKIEIDSPSKSKDKHKANGSQDHERLSSNEVTERPACRKRSLALGVDRSNSAEGNWNLSQQRQSERFSEQVLTNELPKLYLSDGLDSDSQGLKSGGSGDNNKRTSSGEAEDMSEIEQAVGRIRRSTLSSLTASDGGNCAELDQLIKNCLIADEFNKLEHLVLAGWGQRVLDVCNHVMDSATHQISGEEGFSSLSVDMTNLEPNSVQASDRMRRYIQVRVPDCMRSIETVHKCLHDECYAHAWTSLAVPADESDERQLEQQYNRSAGSPLLMSGAQPIMSISDELNASFHKLCNLLLAQKSLVMGRDCYGATPLHVALIRTDKRLIDYLLRCYPETASAPDNEERNALHYAAIVASAQQCHGIIQVTRASSNHQVTTNKDATPPAQSVAVSERTKGYWLVDDNARLVLEQLKNRYEDELGDQKDVKECTYRDYLRHEDHSAWAQAGKNNNNGQSAFPFDEVLMKDTLRPASVFAQCCKEFSILLQRYDYMVRLPLVAEEQLLSNEMASESHVEGAPPDSGPNTPQLKAQVSTTRPAAPRDNGARNSIDSPINIKHPQGTDNGLACAESKRNQRPTSAMSSASPKTIGTSLLDEGDLFVPGSSLALGASAIAARQVAPKPTVGCEIGFPVLSPTALESSQHDEQPQAGDHRTGVGSKQVIGEQSFPHLAQITPSGTPLKIGLNDSNQVQFYTLPSHRHRHRHQHSFAQQSIVGGVIVPTIIHDDKMDEIETYDIIYRQPAVGTAATASNAPGAERSSLHHHHHHHHHHRRDGLQIGDMPVPEPAKAVTPFDDVGGILKLNQQRMHQNSGSKEEISQSVGEPLIGLKSERDSICPPQQRQVSESSSDSISVCNSDTANCSSDGTSSSSDEDEDDKRVERLSNEFETRVKREKNELRARVDQIMSELKMSAKSSKSARFLASPNDLSALDAVSKDTKVVDEIETKKQPKQLKKGAELSTKQIRSNQKTRLSFGSSGHSSAHTSAESASPSSSSTSSFSSRKSSSTCSTGCSKTSISTSQQTATASDGLGTATVASSSSTGASSVVKHQAQPKRSSLINNKQAAETKTSDGKVIAKQQAATDRPHITISRQPADIINASSTQPKNQVPASTLDPKLQICKNTYGQTYLHFIASRLQSASTLYRVLDHGSHLIGERDIFYRTARDVAIQFNLPYNVQTFDKYVIDLFIGCNTKLLWQLLLQGYSPLIHVGDADGNDIMLILKLLKLDRMIHFLLQMADFQRWRDELHTFIRHGYSAGVSELITKHKDLVKAKSVHARTSLHLAILFDRIDMIDKLIEHDPTSVHCLDNMGRTPLHYTYGLNLQNAEQIRDKLLAYGANPQIRDVRMRTPKYYYIFKREIEEIRRIELELN